jgi:DNA-binding transcriptional ArsR family regulator
METSTSHNHKKSVQSALRAIGDQEHVTSLSEIFKVLADPTRLKILMALADEVLCVYDIAEVLGVSDSAVSHQLRMLKTMRLVKQRKDGKLVFYTLDDEHIEDLIRVATLHISE